MLEWMEVVVVHFIALFRSLSPEIEEKRQKIMIAWTLGEIWSSHSWMRSKFVIIPHNYWQSSLKKTKLSSACHQTFQVVPSDTSKCESSDRIKIIWTTVLKGKFTPYLTERTQRRLLKTNCLIMFMYSENHKYTLWANYRFPCEC